MLDTDRHARTARHEASDRASGDASCGPHRSPSWPEWSPRFTVVPVKILQIAPALHGAKMQSTEGTYPVVIWALVERDDGGRDVVGLSVGGGGDSALVPPDPTTFESYSQTG